MITNIIASFDEAFKLEATLRTQESLKSNFKRHILVYTSGQKNKEAHIKVLNEYCSGSDMVYFLEDQDGFKQSINDILRYDYNDMTMLTVAGDVFLQSSFDIRKIESVFENKKVLCFSLRLGKNIKKNTLVGTDNTLVPLKEENDVVYWDWHKHYIDFSAPLSVHCHIFRSKDLKKLVNKAGSYMDVDELEENLQAFNNHPKNIMCSFNESHVCSIIPIFDPKKNVVINALMNKQLFEEKRKYDIELPEKIDEVHFNPNFEKLVNLYAPKDRESETRPSQ